ncbi:MAG: DUF3040 domain-containing protein [Leucobacter sp.]|jgi:hypothetical protein|nr:DUF3040 domain-containing protein [Leucobacter sp.]
MGLSEREQQLLDDMERRFYQSEADVMQTSASHAKLNLRSLVLGTLVVVVGLGLLIASVSLQQWWLGLVAFVVMVGGTLMAFSKRESIDGSAARGSSGASASQASARESFSDRMNRRWEERMDGER